MKEVNPDLASPETRVNNPVFSIIARDKFRWDISKPGSEAIVLTAAAATICCVCTGGNVAAAAAKVGIEIVSRLIK